MAQFENRLYGLDEVLQWDEPEWLIDGFVHKGSSVFLSGPPKTGKSLAIMRLGAAVTSGSMVFGHQAHKGIWVAINAERARLTKPRVQGAIDRGIPFEADNFKMYPHPVPFLDEKEVRRFAEMAGPTDLLTVDTLRRCFTGGRENDNNDMTAWAQGVEYFCELTGAAAIVVHHNHREHRDTRGRPLPTDFAGGGGLLGSLDAQFSLRPIENNLIEIRVEGANEGNYFHAITTTVEHVVGNHTTWVMVEADDATVEARPELEPLVQSIIIENPQSTLAHVYDLCVQDEVINHHWPSLNEGTLSRIVARWVKNGQVERQRSPFHAQQHLHTWIGEQ